MLVFENTHEVKVDLDENTVSVKVRATASKSLFITYPHDGKMKIEPVYELVEAYISGGSVET